MKKKERKKDPELYELQPEELVDISEQAFEDVRASLEKVEAMKQTVADGIIKAKEKNLKDHVEKMRTLLRKLVVMENSLKEEQNKKEAAKMAFELDRLEAECNRELSPSEEISDSADVENKFTTVALRYNAAAKLICFGGIFACLLGCVIYLLLVQIDPVNIRFEWIWMAINGLGIALFAALGVALRQKSIDYMGLAEEAADKRRAEEEEKAQRVADEFAEIMAQAYALELEKENEANKKPEDKEEKDDNLIETSTHGKILSVKKVKKENAEGVHVTVRGGSAVLFATIAAGLATLATFVFAGKRSKKKKEEKKAEKKPATNSPRIQGVFFQMPE